MASLSLPSKEEVDTDSKTDLHPESDGTDLNGLAKTLVKVKIDVDQTAPVEVEEDKLARGRLSERRYVGPTSVRKRVEDWIKKNNEFRLFLVGKVGAGKSSLVNSLLKVDAEGEGAQVGSSLSPVTMVVKNFKGRMKSASLPRLKLTIHNVDIQIWDTPGLQDPDIERARQCLADIKETWKTNDIALLVYCISMTQVRSETGDEKAIQMLTQELGEDIWNRSLFAMTRANEVKVPLSGRAISLESVFETKLQEWDTILKKYLKGAHVDSSIADNIPLVPCGYGEYPLHVLRNPDWSAAFWEACLVRMLFESIPAFLTIHPCSTDGSLSEFSEQAIIRRLEKPMLEEAGFVSSLLEGSTPKEVVRCISDIMVSKVTRRNTKTGFLLFLVAGVSIFAVGMAK